MQVLQELCRSLEEQDSNLVSAEKAAPDPNKKPVIVAANIHNSDLHGGRKTGRGEVKEVS